jgi:hypothetical protein
LSARTGAMRTQSAHWVHAEDHARPKIGGGDDEITTEDVLAVVANLDYENETAKRVHRQNVSITLPP